MTSPTPVIANIIYVMKDFEQNRLVNDAAENSPRAVAALQSINKSGNKRIKLILTKLTSEQHENQGE